MHHPIRIRALRLGLAACLLAGALAGLASANAPTYETTILFTHDTHDHFLPMPDEEGGEYGGYTRLATLIQQERAAHPDALVLDAGDFSMGSLFQTIYATEAPELRALGAMGYDATTLGNHEFDYRARGLAEMLNAAVESGDPVPPIVQANYKPPAEDVDTWAAWNRYGIGDYLILERGGVRYGIFGLMGEEADSNAPMSGMEFEPIADAAERTVAALEEAGADFIICLSHSGTGGRGKGEDYELAKRVDGIDVILSGHTHTTLDEPLRVGDTLIVSCGEYTANLGVLTVEWKPNGEKTVADYRLLPVDETVAEDPDMAAMAAAFQPLVEEQYLSQFGVGFDEVLARSPFAFTPIGRFGAEHREDTLGSLIADSYVYAVQQAEGADYVPVDFAVVAAGVIRGSFPAGEITTSDVFNVSSLGSGADGTPGYPLISVWLTGKELKDAFEVDASVTALMPEAQIYGAGMTWTWNPHRMMFNKVTDCAQVLPDGSAVPIDDDRLYRVVTGLYTGQMLGTVNDQSFGILAITPKDAQGNVITDYEEHIIYNPNGSEVKEWYALASYLQSMGEVDGRYAAPEGRKVEHATWNPLNLLKNLNLFGWLAVLAAVLVLAAVVFLVWRLCFHHRRGRYGGRRRGGGYRPLPGIKEERKREYMKENNYDNPGFFSQYRRFPRSVEGLSAAGEWHALQKLFPDFSGKRVLDLGCGFGWHCRYAADHGAAAVIGVDLSEKMLEKARADTFDGRIHYVRGAMEEVDFPPASFEAVLSSLALHYVEELGPVFRRVWDWLAPGGDFVFSCEHPVFTAEGSQEWYPGPGGAPLHWPVDRYFTEGRRTARFLGCDVVKYHHTLTTYVQTLLETGFVLKALVEPKPDPRLMDVPGMADELRRPMMLLLSAHKPE